MFAAKSLKCITSVNIITVQSITFIFEKKKKIIMKQFGLIVQN